MRPHRCSGPSAKGTELHRSSCPDGGEHPMGDIGYGVASEPVASTASLGRQRCPKCRALATVQNVVPIRAGDTQMHELRPRLWRPNPHRSSEGRCSGLERQRAGAAEVRPGKFRGEAVPILVAERSRLVHLFGANTRAHGVISEATMPTPKRHALTILGAFEEARSELVGKAVILSLCRSGRSVDPPEYPPSS